MKIAFVVNSFKKNFFEQMVSTFPSSVDSHILDVAACFSTKGWLLPSRNFLRQLQELKPDVVYTDYPHYPVWYAKIYQTTAKRGIATVSHLRGDWWREFGSWLAEARMRDRLFAVHRYYFTYMALALSDVVTPICSALNDVVQRHFPNKRTRVIHQGVDPSMFFEDRGVRLEHPNVCIIQNHTILPKVRGLLQFAEVVRGMPGVQFYISGGQPISQPYAAFVQQRFANFPNVHMLGPVSYPAGLRQLLSDADLYVLASGLDMCPTTVLEASLMRRPVVASRVGGVPEIVLEGRTGYTIPNGDVPLWIGTIRRILGDRKLAKELGESGRKWVAENFNWTKIGARTLEAISMALEPNHEIQPPEVPKY